MLSTDHVDAYMYLLWKCFSLDERDVYMRGSTMIEFKAGKRFHEAFLFVDTNNAKKM